MAWPKTRISPASGVIRPISMRRVVVLPAPLGPSRPSTWPFSTRKDRSRTAYRSADLAYRLVRPVICSGHFGEPGSGAGAAVRRRAVSSRASARPAAPAAGSPRSTRAAAAAASVTRGRGGHGQRAAVEGRRCTWPGRPGTRSRGRWRTRTRRSRCPASTSWSTAGRVSVDVLALLGALDPDRGDELGGQHLLAAVRARRRTPCRRGPRRRCSDVTLTRDGRASR